MKKSLITIALLFSLFSACAPAPNVTNNASTVETIVAATLSVIPTATLTPVPSISTGTPVQTLAPLYSEVTWENSGPSEQEVSVNQQTNERITLSGNTFQAPMPLENNLANNVYMYYSNESMASMGWIFVGGWGGATGTLTEFYNEIGYFLTIRIASGQSQAIILWISDETTIIPVLPAK